MMRLMRLSYGPEIGIIRISQPTKSLMDKDIMYKEISEAINGNA